MNGIEPEATADGTAGAEAADHAGSPDEAARDAGRDQAIAACRGELGGIFKTLGVATSAAMLALDLTLAQMRCLLILSRRDEGQAVGKLAATLKVTEPTASQLVERLVQRGLAERSPDPDDRRRTLVTLTDEARGMMDSVRDERERTVHQALAQLDDDQLAALSTGLRALAGACTLLTGGRGPSRRLDDLESRPEPAEDDQKNEEAAPDHII